MTATDKMKIVPWIAVAVLILAMFARQDIIRKQQSQIDSLQTVHERTVHDLREAKRLANSDREGLSGAEKREVMWATRAVLSETHRPSEMLLIANVIRNRLDLKYRGKSTAKGVILDPFQFSAFNPGRDSRWRYIQMDASAATGQQWMKAWRAARFAMTAPRDLLPLNNKCVTHFVHPKGLLRTPEWVYEMEQVSLGDVGSDEVVFFRPTSSTTCR